MTPGNARDASSPLDGVMPGLEETMTGEVIDLRPDRFLREMREHGSLVKACANSGMSHAEFDDLCRSNIKFDRAQVECYLEHFEDTVMADAQQMLKAARDQAYAELRAMHGVTVSETFGKRGGNDDMDCG